MSQAKSANNGQNAILTHEGDFPNVVYETPLPGTPTVVRVPLGPIVYHAPGAATEKLGPLLLMLSRTPGKMFSLR